MAGLAGYPGLTPGLLAPAGLNGNPALGSSLHGAFQPKVQQLQYKFGFVINISVVR